MANVFNTTIPAADVPTPLIFFSPQLAYQLSVATYLHVGSTGALLWDIIDNLGNDFRLLYYYKIRLPTIAYFVTRITLLGFCLGRAVLLTTPVADCSRLADALNALLIVYVASTTGLFYLRVCAVYNMKRIIIAFFGTTWLAAIAMILTFSKTFMATPVENTHFCGESIRGHFLGPTSFVLVTNDVLIYLAIAYRIHEMFLASDTSVRRRFNVLAFGTSLPVLSKALLQDSQLYFLVVLITKGFLAISAYTFAAPINVMFIVCHLVLVNILSCRVYRNIKLGLGPEMSIQTRGITALQFSPPTMTKDTTHRLQQTAITTGYLGSSTPNLNSSIDSSMLDIDVDSIPRSSFHTEEKRSESV